VIPVVFYLGPIPINSFGLMMVFCFIGAWRRLYLSLEAAGENPEIAEKMVVTAAIAGIVGSRVNYLISNFSEFVKSPMEMILSGAGFVFYGGFLFAAFCVFVFVKKNKLEFFRYADLTAPALAIGYGIGRIGCHLSGDGDYGKATDSLLRFSYLLGVSPTPRGVLVHPTPIYESLLALALCAVLLRIQKLNIFSRNGQLFGLYILCSSVFRYFIEDLRIEPITSFGITEAQVTSLILFLPALLLTIFGATKKLEGRL